MHFDSKSPVSFHSFAINFHPSEKNPPLPQPPLQVFMQLLQQIDDLLPLFHGVFTPGALPSLSWLNEPPDDVTVTFAWCEKKQVQLVMYGFFSNGLLLLSLDRCWFVPKQFLCESVFHTLEENFYMVNSEFTVMTDFVLKPNMPSS